jgi:hypothetical protein
VLSALPARLLSASEFSTIFEHLQSELRLVPPRFQAYMNGLPLLPDGPNAAAELPSFEDIEHLLRLLDSYLLGSWAHDDEDGEEAGSKMVRSPSTTTLGSDLVSLALVFLVLRSRELHEAGKQS